MILQGKTSAKNFLSLPKGPQLTNKLSIWFKRAKGRQLIGSQKTWISKLSATRKSTHSGSKEHQLTNRVLYTIWPRKCLNQPQSKSRQKTLEMCRWSVSSRCLKRSSQCSLALRNWMILSTCFGTKPVSNAQSEIGSTCRASQAITAANITKPNLMTSTFIKKSHNTKCQLSTIRNMSYLCHRSPKDLDFSLLLN